MLLAVSFASRAQLTSDVAGSGTGTEAEAEPDANWSSDLKAPLRRPADDVGGSWSAALLYGQMTDAAMVDVFLFNFGWADAKLLSGDFGYTLKEDNAFQKFMDPVLSNIDVAFNVTYQDDPAGTIFVFSPYIMARWNKFPWSNTIHTSFGLGGGLSYATDIPSIEIDQTDPNGDYKKLLHYMAIEATFALPQHKDWHLVYRLHHRSGVFGLMGAENEGNTAVQIGIRHYFK